MGPSTTKTGYVPGLPWLGADAGTARDRRIGRMRRVMTCPYCEAVLLPVGGEPGLWYCPAAKDGDGIHPLEAFGWYPLTYWRRGRISERIARPQDAPKLEPRARGNRYTVGPGAKPLSEYTRQGLRDRLKRIESHLANLEYQPCVADADAARLRREKREADAEIERRRIGRAS